MTAIEMRKARVGSLLRSRYETREVVENRGSEKHAVKLQGHDPLELPRAHRHQSVKAS